ncbi:polysaccharide lyase family 8 super-sandwich domain-containing protein [Aureispira sp. CCB-E]|uniref:polysaccharide lyase family 8 super-sandwich domain-containing protein n=1 Tax=Aureispira sp. CCB-E TaxID=3051121 RepID=UPI0028690418|nr:polysaccharide lyase family 8 super-sandwich domain-containing protein [Aureispira sp. CCB-E]WMX12363.1 polysaccharide lyase family 8 super-sandwich domain-containing protein [Aureispira sp. CCB-E]
MKLKSCILFLWSKRNIGILFFVLLACSGYSQEVIFADYFDIKTSSPAGSVVTGKIHLKRNKDVLVTPVPVGYNFELTTDPSGLFDLTNKWDTVGKMQGLLIGELSIKNGQTTPTLPTSYNLTISLKNNQQVLASQQITVHIVDTTTWEKLFEYYKAETISNSRLYGRFTLSDVAIQSLITEVNLNNGMITSVNNLYSALPENTSGLDNKLKDMAKHIGAMGYAYANQNSTHYQSASLRQAIYKAARYYMNYLPIFGDDISNPIGSAIGDGYHGLRFSHGRLSVGTTTHQWVLVDALGAPLVQVMDHVIADIHNNNPDAIALQESIYRFYQHYLSLVPTRRAMINNSRWRDIADTSRNEGAWADANIHHRMRSLMAMGVIWADYNRPMTYVPYWYDDWNNGTPFAGLTLSKGWSPRGIILDLRHWCTKIYCKTYQYAQSGFHPDGTITHHSAYGASDVALFAYGFEWASLTNYAIEYFKETPYPFGNSTYQFFTDLIKYTYPHIIYKQQLDYVVAGRSFSSDMRGFTIGKIVAQSNKLIANKLPSTVIQNEAVLVALKNALNNNSQQQNSSVAFWNAHYLVHRRENNMKNFFFSVRQKSTRSAGAEDFGSIRRSWHAGSGVFQLRVDGAEYTKAVLDEYDWHILPGVTEEWRTDAMPTGRASLAGPGLSAHSGVVADGEQAMAAHLYDPAPGMSDLGFNITSGNVPSYAIAKANKSYHMVNGWGTAIGSNILRKSAGQGLEIVTCVDQSKQDTTIYYSVNSAPEVSLPHTASHNLTLTMTGPTWLHHDNKGYLIFPKTNQDLLIKTGTHINPTLGGTSDNFIIAIGHGTTPNQTTLNGYHYVLVGDVVKDSMPFIMNQYLADNYIEIKEGRCHAVYNHANKVAEVAFYAADTAFLDNTQSTWIRANKAALILEKEGVNDIQLTVSDPMHDINNSSIELEVSLNLMPGTYHTEIHGFDTIAGEVAIVTALANGGSRIVINLPNTGDELIYGYQELVYAGAPITLTVPKMNVAVLPLELLLFNVQKGEKEMTSEITWETNANWDRSHFEVEWSNEKALSFSKIGTVTTENNQLFSTNNQYLYVHENPTAGVNYYRLKMIDKNGAFEYSDIRAIEFDDVWGNVEVLPNPTTGNSVIVFEKLNQQALLQLYDAVGKMLWEKKLQTGITKAKIELSTLPAGVYWLRLLDENGYLKTFKLEKI